MLERRLCVYNAALKVDASREILIVVMTSYYENVRSCKRHTAVRRVFCFWRFALLVLGLATHYHESGSTEAFDSVSISFRQPHILLSLSVAGLFGAGSCTSLSQACNL